MAQLHLGVGQPALGPDFWNNLTTYVTGVISHSVDLEEFHRSKFHYEPRMSNKNGALSSEVNVPSIFIKLSDILPSAADTQGAAPVDARVSALRENGSAAKAGLSPSAQDAHSDRIGARSQKRSTGRKPWAKNFVELKYCGVQSVSRKAGAEGRHLINNMDAIVRVADRQKFSLLNTKLGQDVLYNPRKGELCIRLRGNVGVPVLQTLKTRLQAVDRVVDSVEAMARARNLITCEKVTLEKVVFTYTDGFPRPEGTEPKRWRVTLDLSKPRVVVHLEDANPHLRIQDLLTRLVNGASGISALTVILPLTLPLLSTVDRIQGTWRELAKAGKGSLTVQHKSLDSLTLHYDMLPAPPGRPRALRIEVYAQERDGVLWWRVCRSDKARDAAPDEFDARLRKVWEARTAPWRGLASGAATRVDDKALNLLYGLDKMIRG
ncbi:hypothetical protein IMZ48_23620, partial [Candidatus Bathyarchaeota archaeon]|nr:hypothetical protein [Candidatus Bathyarchaeota archaeon]